jgi:hypothetical protein
METFYGKEKPVTRSTLKKKSFGMNILARFAATRSKNIGKFGFPNRIVAWIGLLTTQTPRSTFFD